MQSGYMRIMSLIRPAKLLQEGAQEAQEPTAQASIELLLLQEQHALQAAELAEVLQKLDQAQVS